MSDTQQLSVEKFSDIDINDSFFDSLRSDYPGFDMWFSSKSAFAHNTAYTFRNGISGGLDGFLYLKEEIGAVTDVAPALSSSKRLKLGTFKVNPHGTRLGERFMKRAFDVAVNNKVDALYVTVFSKHGALVDLFTRYGFVQVAQKSSLSGVELVFERRMGYVFSDVVRDYPRIPITPGRHFVLSLYPEWHSRLLPDSLLKTESPHILEDVSHTNSIHKIYLAAMDGIQQLQRGDTLLIYRTKDNGSAYYTSVITSLCVVEKLVHISNFSNVDEFLNYCRSYSIFSEAELRQFYRSKKYPWVITFVYNLAFTKRVNRKALLEIVGLPGDTYWGFFQLSAEQLKVILQLSGDYEKACALIYTP